MHAVESGGRVGRRSLLRAGARRRHDRHSGRPDVYGLFLEIGYHVFHLCRAGKVKLPGGVPVFSQVRDGRTPEDVLRRAGLHPGPTRVLDEANALTLVTWTRTAPA